MYLSRYFLNVKDVHSFKKKIGTPYGIALPYISHLQAVTTRNYRQSLSKLETFPLYLPLSTVNTFY